MALTEPPWEQESLAGQRKVTLRAVEKYKSGKDHHHVRATQ